MDRGIIYIYLSYIALPARTRTRSRTQSRTCTQTHIHTYIYASVFRVNLPPLPPPPWYGPPRPWPRAQRPTIRLFKAAYLPYFPLFPHLVKFLANTMQINTTCNDYDSISQHSHQSTRTAGPQGGRGANHDHAQGGGGEERRWSIYTYKQTYTPTYVHTHIHTYVQSIHVYNKHTQLHTYLHPY